jgi:hypothetical protein
MTRDPQLESTLQTHELGHVTQYGILGRLFLPIYGLAHVLSGGHDNNPMERKWLPNWPGR